RTGSRSLSAMAFLASGAPAHSRLTNVLLHICALEPVAASLALMARHLLLDGGAGAAEVAGAGVENGFAFGQHAEQWNPVGQRLRLGFERGLQGDRRRIGLDGFASESLDGVVFLAGAVGRLDSNVVAPFPRLAFLRHLGGQRE